MSERVYQVDELIEKLKKYPDDYQVRVDADGVEVPPRVRKRGPETIVL
jgi:hypothetical protein